jgi:S-adenosylmethionine decarboxylase
MTNWRYLELSRGYHILLDCYDVPHSVCTDDKRLLQIAAKAAQVGGATVINTMRYRFGHNSPAGCAVLVMLDESHISIHTYADEGKMAIDAFTCGSADTRAVIEYIKKRLCLRNYVEKEMERFVEAEVAVAVS